ncbi:hypothetical protein EK21DRAFT_119425 [Setomelanomma holmii]|uniref:Uncharacterized protein n=1 Tax=Setomelanomma holmii TaxID=210430 RepID=A0A9P4GVV5_9PLEO|nr:hypothetical protein EK21DRAFT_119425 [Setomelanomma holmii]
MAYRLGTAMTSEELEASFQSLKLVSKKLAISYAKERLMQNEIMRLRREIELIEVDQIAFEECG